MDNKSKIDGYVQAEGGKYINPNFIYWIKQIDECYNLCTKSTGCYDDTSGTHKICKSKNPTGYNKITQLINASS